jgi:hypothetical protein
VFTRTPVAPEAAKSVVSARLEPAAERRLSTGELGALRALVRSEMATAVEQLKAAQGTPGLAPELAVSTSVSLSPSSGASDGTEVPPTLAFESAREAVEKTLDRGIWTEAERSRISGLLGQMSPKECDEIRAEVIRAANEGRLRVETDGPLFL